MNRNNLREEATDNFIFMHVNNIAIFLWESVFRVTFCWIFICVLIRRKEFKEPPSEFHRTHKVEANNNIILFDRILFLTQL